MKTETEKRPWPTRKKAIVITAITLASVVGLLLLTVLSYLLYVVADYRRIPDDIALEVKSNQPSANIPS